MTTDLTVPGDATPALRSQQVGFPGGASGLDPLTLAKVFAASGYFPGIEMTRTDIERGVAQAAVKIIAGREFGIGDVAAMNGLDIIQTYGKDGKPKPPRARWNATVQAHLAERAGYTYQPSQWDEKGCVLQWSKDGKPLMVNGKQAESSFTLSEAAQAGLVKEYGGWKAWPKNMVLARAITQGVFAYCRHVLVAPGVGIEPVSDEELESTYPDPRDDVVKALFATYREAFPRKEGETEEHYRGRRLVWSAHVLGRPVPSWNGPDYPETLTRADVQTLLDELARLQAAPDSGPAAGPLAPEHPGPANISAGETAEQKPGSANVAGRSPAEHHSDEKLGEVPSPEGAEPGGGVLDMTATPPSGPAPIPTRKRRRTDPGAAPSIAELQKHQAELAERKNRPQQTVDRGPTRWRFTIPQPQLGQLTAMFHGKVNDLEEFLRTFAEQEPDVPALTEWTDRHWPDTKLAVLMEAARAETSLR